MPLFSEEPSNPVNVLGYRLNNSRLNRIGNSRIAPIKRFAILLFFITIFFPKVFFSVLDFSLDFNSSASAGDAVAESAELSANARESASPEKSGKKLTLADIWPDAGNKLDGAAGIGAKTEERKIGLPRRIIIPSINIDANIQSLGIASSGEMETPDNTRDAGWFRLGPRPGQIGNAVLAGHLDTIYGGAAIFWHLHRLKAGDDVYITDENGAKRHFVVASSRVYSTDNMPMEEVFGASDKARVNLITCNGTWDKKKQNYNQRLVVSAELAPE